MSELMKGWGLEAPDFAELPNVLKQCGKAAVKEICRCVMQRQKPTGAPQKSNKMSTVVKKGHDHPIAEKRFRFAREATYEVTPLGDHSATITIRSAEDSEIAASLTDRGYDFFGITEQASEDAFGILDTFISQKVADAFRK